MHELKELAGETEEGEPDEAALLNEEANMPIEELLKRMKQVFMHTSESNLFSRMGVVLKNHFYYTSGLSTFFFVASTSSFYSAVVSNRGELGSQRRGSGRIV